MPITQARMLNVAGEALAARQQLRQLCADLLLLLDGPLSDSMKLVAIRNQLTNMVVPEASNAQREQEHFAKFAKRNASAARRVHAAYHASKGR